MKIKQVGEWLICPSSTGSTPDSKGGQRTNAGTLWARPADGSGSWIRWDGPRRRLEEFLRDAVPGPPWVDPGPGISDRVTWQDGITTLEGVVVDTGGAGGEITVVGVAPTSRPGVVVWMPRTLCCRVADAD